MMQILAHGHLAGGHFLVVAVLIIVVLAVLNRDNYSNTCDHRRS